MRHIAIGLFLISMFSINTLKAQDAMSVWADSAISIDGKIKEWPSFFRFYISGAKLQFDFFNDSSSLYLCVKAVDMDAQSRLMHAGVDLWFDPTGKKKQKIGITFPLKLERAPGDGPKRISANSDPSSAPSERSRVARLKEHVIFAQNVIKVTGMMAVTEPQVAIPNKYGIEIAYDWDSLNILAIEYKIPLSLILQHQVIASDFKNPLGLGIVVGAIDSPRPQGAPESTAGGQSAQQGGMGGSGMGRGGAGSSARNNSQNNLANDRFNGDNVEQKVWLKVHLESKPAK
jgi:hypothetical protein